MYRDNINDYLVSCPYNPYHVVKKLNIQKHLIKCQNSHSNVKFATCLYNFCHRVKPEQLPQHYETCTEKTRTQVAGSYPGKQDRGIDFDKQNFTFNIYETFKKTPKKMCTSEGLLSKGFTKAVKSEENKTGKKSESPKSDSGNAFCTLNKHLLETISPENLHDDFKPLPIPKTTSKAFPCKKRPQRNSTTNVLESQTSREPRKGMNKLTHSTPKSIGATHAGEMDTVLSGKNNIPNFHSNKILNRSVVPSLFDDCSTLKSEEIIFDSDDEVEFEEVHFEDVVFADELGFKDEDDDDDEVTKTKLEN